MVTGEARCHRSGSKLQIAFLTSSAYFLHYEPWLMVSSLFFILSTSRSKDSPWISVLHKDSVKLESTEDILRRLSSRETQATGSLPGCFPALLFMLFSQFSPWITAHHHHCWMARKGHTATTRRPQIIIVILWMHKKVTFNLIQSMLSRRKSMGFGVQGPMFKP